MVVILLLEILDVYEGYY